MRTLQAQRREAIGIDVLPGAFTHHVGSIADRAFVRRCMKGVTTVLHAATLHKPHVATHSRQDFVDVNITGTLNLLEEAAAAGVTAFVYTSTTSVFGDALVPPPGEPAAWITEDVTAVPKNIYGVTKAAAEDLCQLFARNHSLARHRAAHLAVLSRRGRQSRDTRGLHRRQHQDQRIPLSPRRYRRRGQRASAGGPARASRPVSRNTSSAPPRHSRAKTWRNCATTRRVLSAVTCRTMRPNSPGAAGR